MVKIMKKFKPDDLKLCEECGAAFLQANCPYCSGTEWKYASRIKGFDEEKIWGIYQTVTKKGNGYATAHRL